MGAQYESFWDVGVLVNYVQSMPTTSISQKRAKAIVLLKLALLAHSDNLAKIRSDLVSIDRDGLVFRMEGIKNGRFSLSDWVHIAPFKEQSCNPVQAVLD